MKLFYNLQRIYQVTQNYQYFGETITSYAVIHGRMDDYRDEWSNYRIVQLQITELSTLPDKVFVYTTEEYLKIDGCEFGNTFFTCIFDQIH